MSTPADPAFPPPGRRDEDRPAFGPKEVRTLIWAGTVLLLALGGCVFYLRTHGENPWLFVRNISAPGGVITTALALLGWLLRERRAPHLGGLQREAGRQASALEDVATSNRQLDDRLNNLSSAILNNQRAILGLTGDLSELRRTVHGEAPAAAFAAAAPVPAPTRRARRIAETGGLVPVTAGEDAPLAEADDLDEEPPPAPPASEPRYASWDELVYGRDQRP